MNAAPDPAAGFALAVQYAVPAPALPRWRIRRWVQRVLRHLQDRPLPGAHAPLQGLELTLRVVGENEGRQLNREYRERDYATNVLTFEYGSDPTGCHHGDVVLCLPILEREAQEQGKPLLNHAAHLVIHGVLHAVGYDHTEDDEAAVMEALETAILADMGVTDPYQ